MFHKNSTPSALHLARTANGSMRRGIHFNTPGDESNVVLKALENLAPKVEAQITQLKNLEEKSASQEARLGEITELKAGLETLRSTIKSRAGDLPGLEDERQKFDIGKLIQVRKGVARATDIGFELEVLENTHKKYSDKGYAITKDGIISTLTGSDGGVALPIEVSKTIIEAARAQSHLSSLGTYFPQLAGMSSFTVPLEEPTDLSADGIIMQPAATGEGSALPVRSPKWKAESFAPKKLGMVIGVTNEFIKEGGQFLVDYVRNKAATDMANKLEFNVLNGTGEQGQVPRGLLSRTDLASTTLAAAIPTNGRALSFSDLVAMEQAILNENRLVEGGKFGYYMRSNLLQGLRTQFSKQSESGTILDSLPITPAQFSNVKKIEDYVGYKMAYSTLIPKTTQGSQTDASTVVFGDWRYLWVPFWGPMEMLMSNVASVGGMSAFQNDMTFVRFVQMYDVGVMAPNAFTKVSGFTPTTVA